MGNTGIEWTEKTWNPIRGCSRVSPGCGGAAGELGCYAERQATQHAAEDGAAVAWRSLISWVIVGGESGPGARRFDVDWARDIVRQCREARVPCFVEQLGSNPHVQPPFCRGWVPLNLKDRKGADPSEWPEGDWPREFPKETT